MLLFLGSAGHPPSAAALELALRRNDLFDGRQACLFGVTMDPEDEAQGRIAPQLPGTRHFLDYDGAVSRLYGVAQEQDGRLAVQPCWFVLDRMLNILGHFPIDRGEQALALIAATVAMQPQDSLAPVLTVPNILEPDFCRRLIAHYEERGGQDSGFMREVDGRTVGVIDHSHKRRADADIEDPDLRKGLENRIYHRLKPWIRRAFNFDATRIERFIVACYDGRDGGFFNPHRDNTTRGTAHRRFAVTINLNTGDYEGGGLRFPEFGPRVYHAPLGGAVVFSCSLLHEAMPVTAGRRYATLPFLYDEAAAREREANIRFLEDGKAVYKA